MANNQQQFVYLNGQQQRPYGQPFTGQPGVDSMFIMSGNTVLRQPMVMQGGPVMVMNNMGVPQIFPPPNDYLMRQGGTSTTPQYIVQQMMPYAQQSFPPRLPGPGGPQPTINVQQVQHQHGVNFNPAQAKTFQPNATLLPQQQQQAVVYTGQAPGNFVAPQNAGAAATGAAPQFAQPGRPFNNLQQQVQPGAKPNLQHGPPNNAALDQVSAQAVPQNGSLPNAAQPQVAVPGYPAVNANPHQAGAQVQMPLAHGLSQGPPNNQINSGPAAGNGRPIIVSVANVMDTQNAPSNQNAASAQPAATTVSGANMSATQSAPYSTTGVPVADAASAGELGGSGPNKARYGNDRLYIPPGPASTATAVPISQPPIVAVGIDAQHMEVHTIPAPQPATNMPPKRERKPIMIVDPDTNKVVDTELIERQRKERELREKQQTTTPASESQSATHLPSTQSVVITNPVTNAVVHIARTPRSSVSESASKHSLTSQRAEVPASLESGTVSTAVKQETVAAAARDEPRQKAETEPVATLATPSKAATLEKQVVATPAPAETPTQEATKVAAAPAAAAVVDNQEREEGELDKTLDASVSESTGKPGVKLVLACDVVVERSASGRWNYDRDTLMKLRPNGVAPQLAMEFGALEQRTPRSAGVMHGRQSFQGPRSTADTFMPDFMWAPGMTPGPAFTKGMPGMSRGGSYQGARAGKKPMVIEPPPAVAVTLHRVDNAYVPNCVKTQQELSTESELDKLRRKLLSVLNKITPQKFRQLMMRTFELISAVTTPDMLESVVNIIFEKAIAEPNFSVAYSHVCRHLMDVNVPNAANAERPVTFKFLLISKCQKEFEKKGDAPMQEQIKQRYDEINAEPNEEKRTQMRAEVDDIMSKARRRSLGNTKFIGELFKLEILTDTIVYFCLQHYLREGDDDSLECLCKLLITIGKKLESNQKFKDRFNEIFNRIKKIVDEKGCSLRLRCLLQDVLDLRLNDWKPRREEGGPKTIDQIHADAQREETERAMYSQFSQFSTPRGGNQAGEFREDLPTRGSNRRGRDEAGAAANLFAIPSSASSSKLQNASDADADSQMPYRRGSAKPGGQQALEPATTIKLPTATVNAGEVRLGPGAPRKAWGAGSQQAQPAAAASAASSATQSKDSRATGKQPLPATKQGSGGAWRTPNSGPDQRDLPPNRSAIGATNEKWSSQPASFASRVANREQTDAAQSGASSNTGSRDATPDRRGSVPHAGNTNAQSRLADAQSAASGRGADIGIGSGARVDEELQSKRAASTLRDYMEVNCRLLPELVTDLVDMCRAANCDQFVRLLVNEAFEQRGSDRDDHTNARLSCGRLLADMFQQRLLNSTVFTNGLKAVAQDAPDQELDLPRVYDYFAEVLAETVRSADDQHILNCFADILEPLRDSKKSASVFISIFKQLERRLGKDETERLWRSSRLEISSFIDRSDSDSVLKSNNLSYLVGSSDAPKFNVEDPSQFGKQLTSSLEQLLRGGKTNDQIVDWVEANVKNLVSVSELLYAHFVRALMTAVTSTAVQKIRNATTSQPKLVPEVLKLRYDLLNKYIDHKHERELHALCALQLHDVHLAHPSGVLSELFYELSDNDIISDDAFRDWNDKKEPHEDVGFGVARTAVRQFIAQLGTD